MNHHLLYCAQKGKLEDKEDTKPTNAGSKSAPQQYKAQVLLQAQSFAHGVCYRAKLLNDYAAQALFLHKSVI